MLDKVTAPLLPLKPTPAPAARDITPALDKFISPLLASTLIPEPDAA